MAERRWRLAIVTAASPAERDEAFVRRLAGSPAFDVSTIILDESVRASGPLAEPSPFGAGPLLDRATDALWALWERDHPPRPPASPFEAVVRRGARIERVKDIHSRHGAQLLRAAEPDLLVSCSARMFDPEIIAIPRRGVVSLQRRRPPEHFGAGPVGYWELVDGDREIVVSIHSLFTLHRRRWTALGRAREDNLERPEVERFHRTAAAGLAGRDCLRCWLLEHERGPLAVLYGFAGRGRFLFFQIGHDPAADKLSPGALVIAASIRGAIEEGLESYELLRGDEDYKKHWQNDVTFIRTLRASAIARPWGSTLIVAEKCSRALEWFFRRARPSLPSGRGADSAPAARA